MVTRSQISYYDSDQRRQPLVTELRNFWDYRGLIRLLVVRDLTVRYKRSTLGIWWTILNPLLTSLVLWIIFGQIFRFTIPGVPYAVYLVSGILFITYFTQGVLSAGSAIVNSASVLSKVHVPPEVFSLSAATASAANFLFSVVPLLILQLISGVGIPWTVVLVPIPALATLALITGVGLLIASAAVYFYDVLDLSSVLVQLVAYLTPSFYPLEIVPERFLWVVFANPLYSYLVVFRGFVYQGTFAPWWNFAVMLSVSAAALALGVWVFSRSWKKLVVLL